MTCFKPCVRRTLPSAPNHCDALPCWWNTSLSAWQHRTLKLVTILGCNSPRVIEHPARRLWEISPSSVPSSSIKAPFTLQKSFSTARIKVARVPKSVARISCLHVLYSAVRTTAKLNFGTAKSNLGTSCGLSFLVSKLETTVVCMRSISFKHDGGTISWVPPHKKAACNLYTQHT